MKKVVACIAVGVVAYAVIVFGMIQWRVYHNWCCAMRPLREALEQRYPAVKFSGAGSYREPTVYIRAYGVSDRAVQTEMRNWLADKKTELQLSVKVVLYFWEEETLNELARFEL